MDINVLSDQPAKLGLVIHNYPAHKPHLRGRYAVGADQVILPGQVISVVKNATLERLEWVRGVDVDADGTDTDTALTKGELIFVATQGSADGDVINSGKLTGVSTNGGFEISTSRFADGASFEAGDLLVPDGLTGNFIKKPADTTGFTVNNGEDIDTFIIARVVADYAPPVDFGAVYTPAAGVASSVGQGVRGETFRPGRRYGASDLKMLRIELLAPRPVTITGG